MLKLTTNCNYICYVYRVLILMGFGIMTNNKQRGMKMNKVNYLARFLIIIGLIPILGFMILSLADGRIERFSHEMQWRKQCEHNICYLGDELRRYAVANEGRMPISDWCDVLKGMQELDEIAFICPANSQSSAKSSYGLNENLLGVAIEKISPDTVFLFETEDGWNQTGVAGSVLPNIHKSGRSYKTFILLFDGTVVLADKNEIFDLQWNN